MFQKIIRVEPRTMIIPVLDVACMEEELCEGDMMQSAFPIGGSEDHRMKFQGQNPEL